MATVPRTLNLTKFLLKAVLLIQERNEISARVVHVEDNAKALIEAK